MAAVLSDTFVGTNGTSLGGRQADTGSVWRIQGPTGALNAFLGGDGTVFNGSSLNRAVNVVTAGANLKRKQRVKLYDSTGQAGIIFRNVNADSTEGYYFVITNTGWDFFKLNAAGAYTQILGGARTFTPGTWYVLQVLPNGSSFDLYIDGVSVGTASDSTYASGTAEGIHIRNANIDWHYVGAVGDNDPEGGGGDTTPPTVSSATVANIATTSATVGATSSEDGTMYVVLALASTQPSASQVQAGQNASGAAAAFASNGAATASTAKTFSASGLTQNTTYYPFYVATDAAGNVSGVLSGASFTTSTSGDSTPPSMTGSLASSNITQNSYTLTWQAATDGVGVTGYEVSLDGGSQYTSVGNVLTYNVTNRTPGATDAVRVRAFDAAGNKAAPLSLDVTLLASAALTFSSTDALCDINGTIFANQTSVIAMITPVGTPGATPAVKTGLTTDASGVPSTITNAGLSTGVNYRVVFILSNGQEGLNFKVAT